MSNRKNILENYQSKQPDYPDADYFERLAKNVIAEHANPFIKVPFYKKSIVRWIAAAAILLPFVFFFAKNNYSHDSQKILMTELKDIPQETILDYVKERKAVNVSLAFESIPSTEKPSLKPVIQLIEDVEAEDISAYLIDQYGDWENIEDEYLYY